MSAPQIAGIIEIGIVTIQDLTPMMLKKFLDKKLHFVILKYNIMFFKITKALKGFQRQKYYETLRSYLSDRLARYKMPRIIKLVEDLPPTPSAKVMKYNVREEYKNAG